MFAHFSVPFVILILKRVEKDSFDVAKQILLDY